MKRLVFLIFFTAISLSVIGGAQTQPPLVAGVNNNVTGCNADQVDDQYVCDPYLRQKVEPKGACSVLSGGQHCVFVANDYRTVSERAGDGTGEGLTLESLLAKMLGHKATEHVAAAPDAWVGIYRCYHGPSGPCVNGLWPGFPGDTTAFGQSGPEFGFAAGSDPACVSDDKGTFGCIAMFFNRGGTGIVVTRFLRNFIDGSKNPIRFDPAVGPRVLVSGSAVAGKFADLPVIFYDGRGTYVGGWTQFHSDGGHIWWTKSTDGGNTWTNPQNLSNPINQVQRVVFAADKRPLSAGGTGNVYAMFRGFAPAAFYMARLAPGADKFTAPVNVTSLTGPATACVYDAPSTGDNETTDTTAQMARAKSFPTIDSDTNGNVYFAHQERVDANGLPISAAACPTSKDRVAIVLARMSPAGVFTPRKAIDIGMRCETMPAPGNPATDITAPSGNCPAETAVSRAAGVQVQPVLKGNGAHLLISYREGRGNVDPNSGYFTGRTARMDVRVAKIDPATLSLISSRQVSLYEFETATGKTPLRADMAAGAPGAEKNHLAHLPLHNGGTTPFYGDSDDLVAVEEHVSDNAQTSHWATPADLPALRMVAAFGGDTRETRFPLNGGVPDLYGPWTDYAKPGTGASCINAFSRFSNVMTSTITGTVEAWPAQSFKPLSPGVQRSWPVVVRNVSNARGKYRVTLQAQSGFTASWDAVNPNVPVFGTSNINADGTCPSSSPYPSCTPAVIIEPGSSMSLEVFGSTNLTTAQLKTIPAPIKVLVDDLATTQNPDAIIRLNPHPILYDMPFYGPAGDVTERHGRPSLNGPIVTNYTGTAKSPSGGNPSQGGPSQGGPSQGGPSQGGTSITEVQYVVTSGDTPNTTSGFEAVANFADAFVMEQKTCGSAKNQKCHDVQVIVSRTHQANYCNPPLQLSDEIISYSTSGATPSQGGPSQGGPSQGGTTFTLTPSSAPLAGEQAAAAFAAKAVASIGGGIVSTVAMDTANDGSVVGNPLNDAVLVTYRIIHYHDATVTETAPTTKDEASTKVGAIAIPEAEDNKAGGVGQAPFAGNDAYTTVQGTVLTVAAPGVLTNDFGVIDDAFGNTIPISAQLVSGPPNGTLTFSANGSFVYKPKGNFTGLDSFRYRVTEGGFVSATATVWITVTVKK